MPGRYTSRREAGEENWEAKAIQDAGESCCLTVIVDSILGALGLTALVLAIALEALWS